MLYLDKVLCNLSEWCLWLKILCCQVSAHETATEIEWKKIKVRLTGSVISLDVEVCTVQRLYMVRK